MSGFRLSRVRLPTTTPVVRALLGLGLLAATSLLAAPASATASAELYRTAPLGYGRFEARIRFAPESGVISSFFLWKDGSELATSYWNELDFEKLGDCQLQTNSIYGMPESGHEELHAADIADLDLCGEYHTYRFEWLPDAITWSIDDVVLRTDTGADAAAYAENATEGMQMRFNVWPGNASFGGIFSESVLPVHQYIAWARHSAYTPDAGDDGSDFTLTFEESFDAQPSGWAFGSWDSPLGLSTHTADNVTFSEGTAILSLTTDDATGFTGNVPADTAMGGLGGAQPGSGGDSSGGATTGGAASGGAASGGSGTDGSPEPEGGCGCSVPGTGSGSFWGGAPLLLLVLGLWRRRTSELHGRSA